MNKSFNGPGDNDIISSYISDEEQYLRLFTDTPINGESSPGYFSLERISVPEIKELIKEPYIIISLRNPIARTYSAYMHKCRDNRENLDLESILGNQIEKSRIQNNWAWGWYYVRDSFYYSKVKYFMENFKNVKIIFFEDLISKPDNVMNEVTQFLDVEPFDKSIKPTQINKTGIPRYKHARKLAKWIYPMVSGILPVNFKTIISNLFITKPPMDIVLEEKLKSIFRDDIDKLGRLLQIDLLEKWNFK